MSELLEDDPPYTNPFRIPSDDGIFRMREEEKLRKRQERERVARLKVYEKSTATSRMGGTRRFSSKSQPDLGDSVISRRARRSRELVAAAKATLSNDRRHENENMRDFLAKKREMFLVQMSLDTKRAEICKLEEKAKMKEEALQKSEVKLEEDAVRFDTLLKENDKKNIKRSRNN